MYSVYYNLFSKNKFVNAHEAEQTDNVDEALSVLDDLESEQDLLCVFIEDIHSKAQIYLKGDRYYFQIHLTNGLYDGEFSKGDVSNILQKLSEVSRDPESFGVQEALF